MDNVYEKLMTCLASVRQKTDFVPEVALRKRLDSDRFLWGKSEERFFVEQGIPKGWSEEKFRRKVVECAKGYLGCQYRWGGKAADGIDCSGVVFMVYLMNGVLIWRISGKGIR